MKTKFSLIAVLGLSLSLVALEATEGRGVYGPPERAGLFETVSRLKNVEGSDASRSERAEAASALGAFSGTTPVSTPDDDSRPCFSV